MDIDLLSKMVKELILDDDRVVLPGLGCFVAEVVPATFSDKGYTINPPYRRLYFRARPDEGDVLIEFYAKSNNIEYDMAEKIVKDFLVELKSILHLKKTVVFPGLGRLRATKENNLFFVADEDLDIYPAGFGLESISLKTHQESRAEVSAAVAGLKNILAENIEVVSEPTLVPSMGPVSTMVSEPTPEPTPEPETIAEPVSEAEPIAEPTPEPEVVSEPEVKPEVVVEQKKTSSPVIKALLVVLAVLVALVLAYMAVGRLCPELLDSLLYTPEELEILNR
jgi:hypothetical protein